MKNKIILSFCLFFTITLNAQTTKGKDFWLGYMYNLITDAPLEVYIASERIASATVTIPGTGFSQVVSIPANTTGFVSIPNSAMASLSSDVIEAKAIHVVSCDTVSVYSINKGAFSDDATIVYPTPILGNEYMVHTKLGNPLAGDAEFLIVATVNNSVIEIIPSVATAGGHAANTPYTITLNKGDQYQVTSSGDLTGTTIKSVASGSASCSNYAVFSGNSCLNIGGCTACDHIYEQLMPNKAWGKNFIVGKFASKNDLIYRVLCKTNGTSFTIDGGAPITRNSGQFYDFSGTGVTASYVSSNNPIEIMQYMAGSDCDGGMGDPDQVMIAPIEQTMNLATFYTIPSPAVTVFYANIAARTSAVPNIKLNGVNISTSFSPVASNPLYSYARGVALTQGTNYQLSSDTGFCAFVYGMGKYESYTYPVGSSLKDLTTDFTIKSPFNICPGNTWTVQAVYDPLTTNYLWDFGDGATGTGTYTTHSYNAEGSYSVTMTKVLATGCNQDLVKFINVKAPIIKIHGTDSICLGQTVNLWTNLKNDTIVVKIPTGCSDTIIQKIPSHNDNVLWSTGSTDSLITVKPLVTTTYYLTGFSNGVNCTSKDSFTVYLLKPSAAFNANPICQGLATTFTNQSTPVSPTQNFITNWAWDFSSDGVIDSITMNPTYIFATSGTFSTSLIVTDKKGCKDTAIQVVQVYGHSVPDFLLNGGCYNALTTFTNNTDITTNPNTSTVSFWSWVLGDNTTSNLQTPSHTYSIPSNSITNTTYSIQLIATTSNGCKDSITKSITIYSLPIANFTSDSVCFNSASHLIDASNGNGNPLTSYAWDFTGDNNADVTGPSNVNYTMPLVGNNMVNYTVTSTPTVGLSCKNDTSINVYTFPNPTANFSFVNKCINAQPNTFDGSGSTVAIGTVTNYAWSFGDVQTTYSLTATTTHNYSLATLYNVTLTVTSNRGCINTTINQVKVYEKPLITITSLPNVCIASATTFTAQTLPNSGNIISWFWDVNNNLNTIESNGQQSNYIFSTEGTHTVNLVSSTDKGCKDTLTRTVYINYNPKPQFIVDKPKGCPLPHCVMFTDQTPPITTPAKIINWNWNFGNGTSVNATNNANQNDCYTNSSSSQLALFTVTLTTKTDSGCVASNIKTDFITVYPTPIAQYTVVPEFGNVVVPLVHFVNQSVDYSTLSWSFGDGKSDIVTVNPNHTYEGTESNEYYTSLIVVNQYGCIDTAQLVVPITPDFVFYIPNAFSPNGDGINEGFIGTGIGITKYEMWIYDRWGSQIYYTDDITKPWNGKMQGKEIEAKQDVYTWKVELKDVFAKKHNYVGHVTLLR